jgi:hypothetical protein
MLIKLALAILLTSGVALAQSTNGIWVDQPKVYDDYFLQTQLKALKAQLGGLSGLNQTTLSGAIGGVQGATLESSGLNAQALGPAPPQVSTLAAPTGSMPAGVTAIGAYGTTTTGPSATSSVPPAPQSALTLPSTLSPSSLNTLGEMLQLSYQIINYELLIDGSLSDRFISGSQQPKRRVTVGLSITVDPPAEYKKQLENALAEVEIRIANPDNESSAALPSVVTLLPREKTYNVIGMVNHQLSAGAGGLLAGVVNLGMSWTLQRQKAYVYQQQDTLALQTAPSTFAWQFRPALDRKYVASGTRQMFVQFSLPQLERDQQQACSAHLVISTRWRKIDSKSGLVRAQGLVESHQQFDVPFYDTQPMTNVVDVTDIGGGLVRVTAEGNFIAEGLRVRVGGAVFDQSSSDLQAYNGKVVFVAAAQDLATGGAFLINRDGSENAIQDGLQTSPLRPCGGYAAGGQGHTPAQTNDLTAAAQSAQSTSQPAPVLQRFAVDSIVVEPFSDSDALVTIKLSNPPHDLPVLEGKEQTVNPLVVVIGGQVFGLSGNPFRSVSADTIRLLAPIDLIRAQKSLTVEQLLRDQTTRASRAFDPSKYPKSSFAVAGASVAYVSGQTMFLINGSGLDGATVVPASNPPVSAPDEKTKPDASKRCLTAVDDSHSTYMVISLEKSCSSSVRKFLLARGTDPPIAVTVPKLQAPKPKLTASAKVAPGAAKVTLKGPAIDQVALIRFGRRALPFTLSLKKDALTVMLTRDITATEGIRFLQFEMADGSKARFSLTVQRPSR